MNQWKHIINLVRKDLILEVRQQYTFFGILLYIASTLFVLYLTMGAPESQVWNGLFWMIQLFICVNAVAKSFLQEVRGRMLYFYTLTGAGAFIMAKLLFNVLLMMLMSLVSLFLFQLMLGNPVENMLQFTGIVCLGGSGLSLVFTFLAAIAAKAQQNAVMMAILGFPLIIPQLMLLMRISNIAFAGVVQSGLGFLIALLIGMNIMVITLAAILYPFLWKD